MPDGSATGRVGRSVQICDASTPTCPKCERTLRVTVGDGWAVITCDSRTRKQPCGEKLLVVGIRGGICLIVSLTVADFEHLRTMDAGAQLVLRRLGLLDVPLMAAS